MKKTKELDVDFIQSRPLTQQEEIALSKYIKKLKSKKRTTKKLHKVKPRVAG